MAQGAEKDGLLRKSQAAGVVAKLFVIFFFCVTVAHNLQNMAATAHTNYSRLFMHHSTSKMS